jgi:hypothetical protein
MAVQPFWLQKYLMPCAVSKTENLVFNRRAVAWAPALNVTTKKWGMIKPRPNDVMRLTVGTRHGTK